ncbi:MAG: hypothetical protein IJW03_03460 [Clostridia bacterium]|nr:hypothetical protein [Clostridia bacterium]
MKKRIMIVICVLLLAAIALTSCEALFGDKNTNENNDKKGFKSVVYVDDDLDLLSIRSKITDITGMIPFVKDGEPHADGEIALGNTNRDITKKAKETLSAELAKSSKYNIGYIIYKEGNNLAVYWDVADMSSIAIAKFLELCVDEKRLELDDGIVAYVGYDSEEYEREKYWLALEATASPEVVSSFRALYNYFDGAKISDFFANLWDGEVGGFYYTMGARDNFGFLPDLESTKQVLGSIESNGAIADVNKALPAEIKAKIVEFAKSTQSERDGYFYHPQWAQDKSELQTDRYGRDMGHATDIITMFTLDTDGDGVEEKQYPNFCAPNGVKCEEHTGTDSKCSFVSATAYYTEKIDGTVKSSLTSSVSLAVSRLTSSSVKAVASVSSHPDYSSREAFYNWLVAYNATIKEDSGKAHNLSAIRAEITQHGYEDIVLDYLDDIQDEVFKEQTDAGEEPTGLWQKNVDYKAVWGFLKYSGYYNAAGNKGRAIDRKYFPYITKTFVNVIALAPDGDYASNDLFNQWDGIVRLISNAQKYYDETLVEEIRDILRENAADLIDNSLLKIDDLNMGNGTFSLKSDGTSPAKMYGASISPGIVEGNVNSTNIITSMYRSAFEALGYTPVPLMTGDDGERFIETICTIGDVEKIMPEAETIDFEDGELPVGLKYKTNNSSFSFEITDAPDDSSNNAFYISSPSATGGDNLFFSTVGTGADCYLFESDIYVSSETETSKASENIVQIKLGHYASSKLADTAYMLILKKNGDKIDIVEASSTSSTGVFNTVVSVDLDDWFTLRLEYYPALEESDVPAAKIWLDGDLIYVSENVYFGSHDETLDAYFGYDTLNIYALKSPSIYMYLDNCFFGCESKILDLDDETISDSRN